MLYLDMCFFRKKKTILVEKYNQLSQEETDVLLKDLEGDDLVPFPNDFSTKEQNLLDCIIDDDDNGEE